MTTPVATVDATGLHVPDFNTVLTYFQTAYQGIYGSDVVLTPDTQDGQWIGILAAAINDANAASAAVYNAFSPSTAQGAGLSSNVKINGLAREVASYSQSDLLIVGVANSVITNGVAADLNGVQWALPASVVIPSAGQVTVTATCSTIGAITAPAGTITNVFTPTYGGGWQTVTNLAAATPGDPVETDAQLRIRQSSSPMLPSQTGLDGLVGAVLAVPGVTACVPYENDTAVIDVDGLPPHSMALVVTGGNSTAIAQAILLKKMVGATLAGTTSVTVNDASGIPRVINFYRPGTVPIYFAITLKGTTSYTVDVGTAIQNAMSAWVNALADGADVSLSRAYTPANAVGTSYEIVSLLMGIDGVMFSASDIVIPFNQTATCLAANVAITVTT